jgi:peptidyl-prolyl cis-trans isomerase D
MLQAIRERAQGVFAWVILILIAVPFALWGIQNYFDTGKEMPVAVVGDREFFQRDVNRAYEQVAQNLADVTQFDEQQLRKQALDRLIRDEVLLQATKELGIVVTDSSVRDFIQSMNYFQTDGKFDKEKYKLILSSQRKSSPEFTEQVRKALEMEQYQRGVTASGFVTDYQLDRFFRLFDQERTIEYVLISAKPSDAPVNDEVIEQYYQTHVSSFQTPERVTVEFLELNLEDLARDVHPTEEELRAFYEEQKDVYTTEERRKVSHILAAVSPQADPEALKAAQEKINRAKQRIQDGEDFAVVARELSDDAMSANNGGDLGLITRSIMEKNFDEAAFALSEGEVSEPVKTSFGFHLIKITELEPGRTKPFADVKEEVKKVYQLQEAENMFYQAGETLAELSYEHPDSIETAAQALDLTIKRTGPFTHDKGDDIATEAAVRQAAFIEEVLSGHNSEPIEIGSDRLIVLRISEHFPAETKPLADVRQQIIEAIRLENARKQAHEQAKKLYQQLKQRQSLEELAAANDLKPEKPAPIKRAKSSGLSWALVQAVFEAAKPQEGQSTPVLVALPNGDQAVVNLVAVKDGGMSKVDAKKREAVKAQLANAEGQALFNSLISQLRSEADVTVIEQKN